MPRIVRQVHLKGTAKLLELTEGLDRKNADELLGYIASLENS